MLATFIMEYEEKYWAWIQLIVMLYVLFVLVTLFEDIIVMRNFV